MPVSLLDLPNELILYLARILSNSTLNSLILTNRRLAELLNPVLWLFNNFDVGESDEDRDNYMDQDNLIGFGMDYDDFNDFDTPFLRRRVHSSLEILTYAVRTDNTAILQKLFQHADLGHSTWETAIDDAFSVAVAEHSSHWQTLLLDLADKQHQKLSSDTLSMGLQASIMRNHPTIAKRLLQHGPIPLASWAAACVKAVQAHDPYLLDLILDLSQPDPSPTTEDLNKLFHTAVLCMAIPCMDTFLQRGAEIDSRSPTLAQEPALHVASRGGSLDVVAWLVKHGADVNRRAYNDRTAAHWAAGNEPILKLLVGHGADIHLRDRSGRPPLADAIRARSPKGFRYLLNQVGGFAPGFVFQDDDLTWLPYALEKASGPEIRTLLLDRIDLDKVGTRILHDTVSAYDVELLKELAARGVPLGIHNRDGMTVFQVYASFRDRSREPGLMACAKFVLDTRPESLTEVDRDGNTPLHLAVRSIHRPMVQLLLKRGSSPVALNHRGQTPISIVENLSDLGYKEIFDLLEPFIAENPNCGVTTTRR